MLILSKINFLSFFLLIFLGCTNGQTETTATSLSAKEFAQKINSTPNSQIVDVRTQEEYTSGHLVNAANINWNSNDFSEQINKIDKSKPVFVYCLRGSRSAAAAKLMRSNGFKDVFELVGGIDQWNANKLPLVNSKQ